LLSPELPDWVDEMFEKVRAADEGDAESIIAPAEGQKLLELLNELPVLGPDDKFAGLDLDIPREIEMHFTLAKWHEGGRHHWPSFDFFHRLKAVQKVRFVELCRKYGWNGEYPRDRSHRFASGRWGLPELLPLSQWEPRDEAELRALLDVAAR
jgi:hypothetical protein